jgi:hypothetical protein
MKDFLVLVLLVLVGLIVGAQVSSLLREQGVQI